MNIIHKTIYTCEEATRLIIKKDEEKLSILQRTKLWLHLAICSACKRFKVQNKWLDSHLHKMAYVEYERMPIQAKKKIATALDIEKGKNTP
jgi:hypothetical protein